VLKCYLSHVDLSIFFSICSKCSASIFGTAKPHFLQMNTRMLTWTIHAHSFKKGVGTIQICLCVCVGGQAGKRKAAQEAKYSLAIAMNGIHGAYASCTDKKNKLLQHKKGCEKPSRTCNREEKFMKVKRKIFSSRIRFLNHYTV
jgi:hypothetical protein